MKTKVLLIGLAALELAACTNPNSATKVLKAAGYSDIQITGYDWFSCSESDFYHTGFSAKGPTGIPVKGVVCEGIIFKASTIRFE